MWVQTQEAWRYVASFQLISGMGHGTYQRPGGLSTTSGFQNEKRKFCGFASAQHQRPEIERQFPLEIFYLDVIGIVAPPVRETFVSQSHVLNGKFGWFCLVFAQHPMKFLYCWLRLQTSNGLYVLCRLFESDKWFVCAGLWYASMPLVVKSPLQSPLLRRATAVAPWSLQFMN